MAAFSAAPFSIAFLVLLASSFLSYLLPPTPQTLLQTLAHSQFAWQSSTTPIPISAVSVIAKALLSQDTHSLPPQLSSHLPHDDTLHLQVVRDYTNAKRLSRVKQFCSDACDVNEVDPHYGLTPLHLAAITGDKNLHDWLLARGAVPTSDRYGRKPLNLSFTNFIANSKKWRKTPDCDFPTVDFSEGASGEALNEVRRLVGEGEPVLMRRAYTAYDSAPWGVENFVHKFRDTVVTVGLVPYANAFNLTTKSMPLGEYYDNFVKRASEHPSYVFNKGSEVCRSGYTALVRLVEDAFPGEIIAHPGKTGGLDGIHFFFGARNSGAPFHVHADAVNAAVSGRKKWFVYTPGRTLYSRKSVKRWVDEDYAAMKEDDKPLECVQRPGDVVYVPLDWGHAVLNLDDNTFGFALEVLNRRDTLSHLWK